ncbi:MAG: TIGR01212 family radical SAM protein [Muribaculum sp.]|nr:TIGR01212 family radical SAM protein [Muribaculum sp.]
MSHYRTYSDFLKTYFSEKIQKLTVNASLGCPNRDGTIGRGGCIYCDNRSFNPSYCRSGYSISQQIEAGKQFFAKKYPDMKYLAYFQAYTSTHGDNNMLLTMYNEALADNDVKGLIVGTRPDCIPDSLLDKFEQLRDRTGKHIFLEYGAESSHNQTLQIINRCHTWECTVDTVNRTHKRGIPIGLHFIMGLPGETHDMMMDTIGQINTLPIDTVKFHQLQVISGTPLHRMINNNQIDLKPFSLEEYLDLCVEIVKRLDKRIAIERFTGQAPANMLVAPKWGIKNHVFTDKLNQLLSNER